MRSMSVMLAGSGVGAGAADLGFIELLVGDVYGALHLGIDGAVAVFQFDEIHAGRLAPLGKFVPDGGDLGRIEAEVGVQGRVCRLAVAYGGRLVPDDSIGAQCRHEQGGMRAIGDGEQRAAIHRTDDVAGAPGQPQANAQVQKVGGHVCDASARGAEGGVQIEAGAHQAGAPCRRQALEPVGLHGRMRYSASKMPAAPMPVPTHIVTMPYLPPVRRRPCTRVAVRIAPVAPKGWPSAIAPPRGLILSGSSSRSRMTASDWAAKASFSSIQSRSCWRMPLAASALGMATLG